MSPTETSATGISTSSPPRSTRARSGRRAISWRSAAEAALAYARHLGPKASAAAADAAYWSAASAASPAKSEEAAREAGPIEVYATSFKPMQGAFAGKADRVLMKLIVCADTRVVLGCHIVAANAG